MSRWFRLAACLAVCCASAALPARAQASAGQAAGEMAFPLDAERRARNFDNMARQYGPADQGLGSVAHALREALATTDPISPHFARYQLSSANLGDVLALAYFSAVMLADGGRTDDPTQAQIDGIRRQIASASGSFAAFSPAERQDFADMLLFSMLLQHTVAEGLAGTPALDRFVGEFTQANSRLLGFDVSAVRIAPDGQFALPGRTEAAASAPAVVASGRSAPATGPLANLSGSPIHGVGVDQTVRNVFGPNGLNLEGVTTVFVLFEDGSACIDCLDHIVDGTLAAFGQENPDGFGRWTRRGATYTLTRADGEQDLLDAGALAPPSPAGMTLAGQLRGIEGSNGVQSVRDLELRADGTFLRASSTTAVARTYTAYAERAPRPGHYQIDGYRIVLRGADGSEQVLSFFPKLDEPGVFIIGGTPFVPEGS